MSETSSNNTEPQQDTKHEGATDHRTIIFVGRTGTGKSSLANTLIGERVFATSSSGGSCTGVCSYHDTEHKGISYRFIDTIGLGDTNLTDQQVLARVVMAIGLTNGAGVNQFVWVCDGRFTKAEAQAFSTLDRVVFDSKMTKHLTIVRTRFNEYDQPESCAKDIQELRGMQHVSAMLQHVPDGKILHIENDCTIHKRETKNAAAMEDRQYARDLVFDVLALQTDAVETLSMQKASQLASEYKDDIQKLVDTNTELMEKYNQTKAMMEEGKRNQEHFEKEIALLREETKARQEALTAALSRPIVYENDGGCTIL